VAETLQLALLLLLPALLLSFLQALINGKIEVSPITPMLFFKKSFLSITND